MANNPNREQTRAADLEAYIDQQIAERVEEVRDAQVQMGTLSERVDRLKAELIALLEQKGSNWSDDVGYARLVSEGIRRTYDTKSLDELIISDPLHYGWLKDYRKESTVRGGVQVK
jgi:hypothetical protein